MTPRKLVLTEVVGSKSVRMGEFWTNADMQYLIIASDYYPLATGDIHWELLPQEENNIPLTWDEWLKEQEKTVISSPKYVELCRMDVPPMCANESIKFKVTGKKVMRNEEGQELKRVKSGKIKPGRYYTDEHATIPILWTLDAITMGADTKVWKVKK